VGTLVFIVWVALFSLPLLRIAFRVYSGYRQTGVSVWGRRPVLLAILLSLSGLISYFFLIYLMNAWTDLLWFRELKQEARFWTALKGEWGFFAVGFSAMFAVLAANIRIATRLAFPEGRESTRKTFFLVFIAISAFLSLMTGSVTSRFWEIFLLYRNQTSFAVADPVFGRDVGFYIFTVPVLEFVRKFLFTAVALSTLAILPSYVFGVRLAAKEKDQNLLSHMRWIKRQAAGTAGKIQSRLITHLFMLGAFFCLVVAFHFLVRRWDILLSTRGAVFGAGWTDINVDLRWGYTISIAAALLASGFLAYASISRSYDTTIKMARYGFFGIAAIWLLVDNTVPAAIQHFYVSPNEQKLETRYIAHNIEFTRRAYGLTDDRLHREEFPVNAQLEPKILAESRDALGGIRLWDYRVMQSTNAQKQAFRLYYSFPDVDVVRYRIGGKTVPMMYSARELDISRLSPQAKTWQNIRLVYTHGFGGCANPVNVVAGDGLPEYWLKDIPPMAKYPELSISQPRIYFGQRTGHHVFVRTKHPEFDYPDGDKNVSFFYDGPAGVDLSSWFRRFVYALKFDGFRLLTADEITDMSRILYRRDILTRVRTLAPFLKYDEDPYQVIAQGGLWYIQDAYTWTDRFPYSEPSGSGFNYIRNSVKATINAYSGEVKFYAFDNTDPIVVSYMKIFPEMFKPAAEMPAELKRHIRYPEGFLKIQGKIFSLYHMSVPNVFYNKEDAWEPAREIRSIKGQETPVVEPYYLQTRLPGEKKDEFVIIQLYTPLTTSSQTPRNLVGWLAGRCDEEHYGKLILYTFPKNRLVYGPLQIGARFNQNEVISRDFTLWNKEGSEVVLGDMQVIPLSGYRLIYVQPVYLQAEVGRMPELRRVVVSTGDQIGYGSTFEEALKQLVGGGPSSLPAQVAAEAEMKGAAAPTGNVAMDVLAKEAAKHLDQYRKLTAQGKHAEAGKELESLGKILDKLVR
jgi:hypothetical protein